MRQLQNFWEPHEWGNGQALPDKAEGRLFRDIVKGEGNRPQHIEAEKSANGRSQQN